MEDLRHHQRSDPMLFAVIRFLETDNAVLVDVLEPFLIRFVKT